MKKKYPTFERVTAGRLWVGATVLVREAAADHVLINGSTWEHPEFLPPDTYEVLDIQSHLVPAGSKRSRYYTLTLKSETAAGFIARYLTNEFSSVLRWNRVVPNG